MARQQLQKRKSTAREPIVLIALCNPTYDGNDPERG